MTTTDSTTPTTEAVMDYPDAWAFVRGTQLEDHAPRCSWRTEHGALLCDCSVIWREYGRREARADLLAEVEGLASAALNVLDFVETTGCHCPNCQERTTALRVALDPFLPTADDVRGILVRQEPNHAD